MWSAGCIIQGTNRGPVYQGRDFYWSRTNSDSNLPKNPESLIYNPIMFYFFFRSFSLVGLSVENDDGCMLSIIWRDPDGFSTVPACQITGGGVEWEVAGVPYRREVIAGVFGPSCNMLTARMGATASHPWTPWMKIWLERGEIGLVYTRSGSLQTYEYINIPVFIFLKSNYNHH